MTWLGLPTFTGARLGGIFLFTLFSLDGVLSILSSFSHVNIFLPFVAIDIHFPTLQRFTWLPS